MYKSGHILFGTPLVVAQDYGPTSEKKKLPTQPRLFCILIRIVFLIQCIVIVPLKYIPTTQIFTRFKQLDPTCLVVASNSLKHVGSNKNITRITQESAILCDPVRSNQL